MTTKSRRTAHTRKKTTSKRARQAEDLKPSLVTGAITPKAKEEIREIAKATGLPLNSEGLPTIRQEGENKALGWSYDVDTKELIMAAMVPQQTSSRKYLEDIEDYEIVDMKWYSQGRGPIGSGRNKHI